MELRSHNENTSGQELAADLEQEGSSGAAEIIINKGYELYSHALHFVDSNEHKKAKTCYEQSIAHFDQAFQLVPHNFQLIRKLDVLNSFAGYLTSRGDHIQASGWDALALSLCNDLLAQSPESRSALFFRGQILVRQALQATSKQPHEAEQLYEAAIASYNHAMNTTNNNGDPIFGLAVALSHLAELLVTAKRLKEAEEKFKLSIATYDLVIPEFWDAYVNKALALHNLGKLYLELKSPQAAQPSRRVLPIAQRHYMP